MYHIAPEKIELLVMGADDELVKKAENPEVRQSIREEFGITQNDFLIVNGGKIDAWKKQTLLLMDAINEMADSRVKLLLFGSVTDELRLEVEKRCSDKVLYIGWVKSETSYDYFAAADLVVFPGRHSVFGNKSLGKGFPWFASIGKARRMSTKRIM